MKQLSLLFLVLYFTQLPAQTEDSARIQTADSAPSKSLKIKLNSDGSHFFQVTFLNQVWIRYNENNPGTTRFSKTEPTTFDIGLRRTRIQMFGQITDRAFLYFQFGQNNFNSTHNYTGNRKIAAFFHDALCEYRLSRKDQLKLGAGLTIANGLSRFSQPSVSTIMTLDVPVFLQYSVDIIDQFDRRLAVYARGQIGKFDYRVYLSNPFPVSSNGNPPPPLSFNANFVNTASLPGGRGPGIQNQIGTYLAYNFFENEGHLTPYMNGTYLGTKKVWNVAVGAVHQSDATWNLQHTDQIGSFDTVYNDLKLLSFETFVDLPLNREKRSALNFFAGYFNTDYGKNYLRYNGSLNPGTGSSASNLLQSNAFGNTFPMFGSGQVLYVQGGLLLPKNLLSPSAGQLMTYFSLQNAWYSVLNNQRMTVVGLGINWLLDDHRTKLSLEFQNRPTYFLNLNDEVQEGVRKSSVTLQFQIAI
jgi:hypothetical protein